MTKRLAVIGGGASAALLVANLARLSADVSVDVYDRTGRFARGVAYSTGHERHLLNVRAANMSAYHDDKDHFASWAMARGYAPMDFVPRVLYGHYLEEQLEQAEARISVRRIGEDVLSCVREGRSFTLQTLSGAVAYDNVVLASGNVRALEPRHSSGMTGYYNDPWSADFDHLKNISSIALIGSGLTAVDMVLALNAQGYGGKILVFSRNGLFPARHVDPVPFSSFLSAEDECAPPHVLLSLIRKTIARADVPWQSVIDSLRPHTNAIWQSWGATQRERFNKRLLTFWNVHRHRMAPQIADIVDGFRSAGRLVSVKGGVSCIEAGPVVQSTGGRFDVDAVINCLGYRYEEAGRAYDVGARLGPARFGELFETTAIPEIRMQARMLAEELAQ